MFITAFQINLHYLILKHFVIKRKTFYFWNKDLLAKREWWGVEDSISLPYSLLIISKCDFHQNTIFWHITALNEWIFSFEENIFPSQNNCIFVFLLKLQTSKSGLTLGSLLHIGSLEVTLFQLGVLGSIKMKFALLLVEHDKHYKHFQLAFS